MTEIPYLYHPSNWFYARILVHQRFTELNRMRDSLEKVGELKCFQDGVFRHFVELPRLRIFGGRLCQLLLCREVNHLGGNTDEMRFRVGQTDIRFVKLEFCLVTGLQFGMIPTNVVHGYEDVDGGHVLLGIKYGKTVPKWACMFVENLTAFECFPWGTYIDSQTVYYLRWFMTGRNKKSQNSNKKQNLGVNIYGFAWAFQVWAMEDIPYLTGVGLRISNVYPRLMNWCCKKKPKNLDNEFTDEMEAILTLTPTADELQQDYMAVFNLENAMGNIPETSKDTVTVSESDKELLLENVTREMKSKANHNRRKKKTYVDPQEVTTSDMWEKLLAHVTDLIKAAEKRITESFTRQFKILHEEVQSLRNAPYTQSPNCTFVYDDHHDWGNPSDRSFLDHDSTKATAAAPKPQHMESAPQFQLKSQEKKRKRKPSAKLQTPYTRPLPFYNRVHPQMSHTLSLKEFVKPGSNIFRDVGLPEKQNQNWFRRMKSVRSDLDDTHIDCFTRLLKRKIEVSPELFKTRIGILPTYFFMLIPCCVCSSHWVLCELNLYTYKIEIYDSLQEGNDKYKQLQQIPHIKSLVSFLPGILRAGGYYERRISEPKPVEVDVVEQYLIPQRYDTGSYGVFIMKYMENILQDKCYQMDFTSDDMKDIRNEIAKWFFQASKPCQ
ncbi:hypothetical protein Ddye_011958 [Dipteronia dyeriana]|uniref:Ubiquitin-like protease family profile domain-containing protein n=1 Tax=Dipteronia dyeriana TaxID=168575 RepID=A0AAD9X3L8_9ROSI|nr:hypothetical protein Ddye_011958 [Dipteronia dyeriana]